MKISSVGYPAYINNYNFNKHSEAKNTSPYSSVSFTSKEAAKALKANALNGSDSNYKLVQTFDVPFYKDGYLYQLNNGQKVVIIPKPGQFKIETVVGVGSLNEKDNIAGISHFIEHSLFNGSEKLEPGAYVNILNKHGAQTNASTGVNNTSYYITAPTNSLKEIQEYIRLQSELVQNPSFDEKLLDKEKKIVISEISEGSDDAEAKPFWVMFKNTYGIETPFDDLVAGTESSVRDIPRQEVLDYHKTWYTPDNMTTVIVGDVKPEKIMPLVSKYFNKPASDSTINRFSREIKPLETSKEITYQNKDLNSSIVEVGLLGPKANDIKETIAVETLLYALSSFSNSRLTSVMRGFNTDAECNLYNMTPNHDAPQIIAIETTFSPGDEKDGLDAIKFVLKDVLKKPITQKELDITKNKIMDEMNISSETADGIATMIGSSIIENGSLNYYTNRMKMIQSLTVEDLQRVAKKYLDLYKMCIVTATPENKQTPRSQKKSNVVSFTGKIAEHKLGKMSEVDLTNNVRLVLNDNPNVIRTSMDFSLKLDNPANVKPGVPDLLEKMMLRGTKNHSESNFYDVIDSNCLNLAATLNARILTLKLDCLNQNFPKGLEMLKEVLISPDFTKKKLNEVREELRLDLTSTQRDATDLAQETLFPDHEIGNTSKVVLENLDNITLKDIKDYYNYILENSVGYSIITSNFKENPELKDLSKRVLSTDIKTVNPYHSSFARPSIPLTETKVVAEKDKGHFQAHINEMFKINETGIIKDSISLELLDYILGADFCSRIFEDLREKQGLAYDVSTSYSTSRQVGFFNFDIKTTTEEKTSEGNLSKWQNLQKSLDGFNKHINLVLNEKVTEEELQKAKKQIKNTIESEIETCSGKTSMIKQGFNTQLETKYFEEYLKALDGITSDDIKDVANLYFNKPHVISVYASPKTIKESKEYLKTLGSLSIY